MINAMRQRREFRADEYAAKPSLTEEPQRGFGPAIRRSTRAVRRSMGAAAADRNVPVAALSERDRPGDLSRQGGTVRSSAGNVSNLHSSLLSSNVPTHMHPSDSPVAALVQGAVDQEKARISRELHDDVVQLLFAMKIDCAWLRQNLTSDPARAMEKLATMQSLLEGSAASVRRIAAGLRPQVLEESGFVPAVQWLARDFTERTGTPCELDAPADLELQDPYGSTAFRIIQEALSNVRKHACATHVKVTVAVKAGVLNVSIQDDGRGFRVADARRPDAMGLSGLRERAQLVDGDITLSSVPGTGTIVSARIPLRRPAAGKPKRLFADVGEGHALQ